MTLKKSKSTTQKTSRMSTSGTVSNNDMKTVFQARQKLKQDHSKVDYHVQTNFDKIDKLEKQIPAENRPEKPVFLLHEFLEWRHRLNLLQKCRIQKLQNEFLIDLSVYQEYFQNEQMFAEMVFDKTSERN